MMQLVLGAELGLALLVVLGFVVVHGAGPWRRTAAGRQLMVMAVVAASEFAVLLAVLYRVHLPWLLLAVVYGAVDVVMIRWLLLRWRFRREGE